MVQLADGRIGKVVRVDTLFPGNATTVSGWTGIAADAAMPFSSSTPMSTASPSSTSSPSLAKVSLGDIVGAADKQIA
jgi:hypothetical protein